MVELGTIDSIVRILMAITVLVFGVMAFLMLSDRIKPVTVLVTAIILGIIVTLSFVMQKVLHNDYTSSQTSDNEIVMSVTPTMTSLPLEKGDTVKIYGYTEDGTIFKDNIDKEYTIYSVEDRFSISPVDVRCSDVDAKELREILSKSKDVEVVKVSP